MKTELSVINERPANMSFDEYKTNRSESNAAIRRYLKGRLYFLSARLINIGTASVPKWVKTKPELNRSFVGESKKLLTTPL